MSRLALRAGYSAMAVRMQGAPPSTSMKHGCTCPHSSPALSALLIHRRFGLGWICPPCWAIAAAAYPWVVHRDRTLATQCAGQFAGSVTVSHPSCCLWGLPSHPCRAVHHSHAELARLFASTLCSEAAWWLRNLVMTLLFALELVVLGVLLFCNALPSTAHSRGAAVPEVAPAAVTPSPASSMGLRPVVE